VWDAASEASCPLCSVMADSAAVVQIVVRIGRIRLGSMVPTSPGMSQKVVDFPSPNLISLRSPAKHFSP